MSLVPQWKTVRFCSICSGSLLVGKSHNLVNTLKRGKQWKVERGEAIQSPLWKPKGEDAAMLVRSEMSSYRHLRRMRGFDYRYPETPARALPFPRSLKWWRSFLLQALLTRIRNVMVKKKCLVKKKWSRQRKVHQLIAGSSVLTSAETCKHKWDEIGHFPEAGVRPPWESDGALSFHRHN